MTGLGWFPKQLLADMTSNSPSVGEQSRSFTNSCGKPVVLAFIGNYLPGYKAGGILRSVANTVENLRDDVEFWIVTKDRDLGDDRAYRDVKINQWQPVGSAMVYYLPPELCTVKGIVNLILGTRHNVLYLNSFFDPFTLMVLISRKLGRIPIQPVIVAPRGEFAWASLRQKYIKKFAYIRAARLLGLYRKVTWHASSEYEAEDIIRVMKISPESIHLALDLPNRAIPDTSFDSVVQPPRDRVELRLVFLSRIAREKNLDYALRILSRLNTSVVFDIYGPVDNAIYWKECQEIISQLPANVKVNYFGSHNQPVQIFGLYDIFLFPTGGENYGHVIAESLSAGTPVLISDRTPWRNLQNDGLGWDIALEHMKSFVEVIERHASLSVDERLKRRTLIRSNAMKRLLDPAVLDANRTLFQGHFVRL